MVHGITGWAHVLSATLALGAGSVVLLSRKGTRFHRKTGYVYAISMVCVNASAFLIYRLFGSFGPFHIAALVSLGTLMAGMIPVIRRKPDGRWLALHQEFMSWSVVGLYAAFVAETGVRFFPMQQFWPVVAVATVLISATGGILIARLRNKPVLSGS